MDPIAQSLGTCRVTRRQAMGGGLAFLAAAQFSASAFAEEAPAAPETAPEAEAFSFDWLSERMKARAAQAYEPPVLLKDLAGALDYDDYRRIRYNPERARWSEDSGFRLHAFHIGGLFAEPVRLYELAEGQAREMTFSAEDFVYDDPETKARLPLDGDLPIAGFRLMFPLNRPEVHDEVVSFLGASYFRALGRGSAYGLSARGLAVDTATGLPEEFPRFSAFYLERPPEGANEIVFYAELDGESVTGAYRFALRPGAATEIDVTARLYIRAPVELLGVAPMTSMFLYDGKNRSDFDDFRPRVHDSEGLSIRRRDGVELWRPLNNPPRLAESWFSEDLASFALEQRDRAFVDYQDAEARYERRPSLRMEPLGDWGPGAVRLLEIPTRFETNDNIVAFFAPEAAKAEAGESREFVYRLSWGDLPTQGDLARVTATRAGAGGVSGTAEASQGRKFVVDFVGGPLPLTTNGTNDGVEPVVTASGAEIAHVALSPLPEGGIWRLVVDAAAPQGEVVELTAHLTGGGRRLSENWLYQWRVAP